MPTPTIYYIRHGETAWNAAGRLQGTQDVPLNDLGRRQAARAGSILADLFAPDFPVPIGVLEAIAAPIYEEVMLEQEQRAISDRGPGSIAKLLTSGDTWKIG